jgi:hypothetical protein
VLPLGPVFGDLRLTGQLLGLLTSGRRDLRGPVDSRLRFGAPLHADRVPAGNGLARGCQNREALRELGARFAKWVVVLLLGSRHDLHLHLVGRHRVVR